MAVVWCPVSNIFNMTDVVVAKKLNFPEPPLPHLKKYGDYNRLLGRFNRVMQGMSS